MANSSPPTRWIGCVDGTWCTPDGPYGNTHHNISNTYRICASIKVGACLEKSSGNVINQQKKYYNGLGSESDLAWSKRLYVGAFGTDFENQISQVYEDCCKLPEHAQNEVWLFGFSRGAYAVRAVAGLLHYFQALKSAGSPAFAEDFKHVLRLYRATQQESNQSSVGQIHQFLVDKTRKAPRIKFVGVLDTVKALDDKSLYDISFNDSIQHLRHALALNEDRKSFEPEYYFPAYKNLGMGRSFIQAWFVGAHIDIGGSAARDGLALYPLQWMLTESQGKGLVLEFDRSFDQQAAIDCPLDLVFPPNDNLGKGVDMCSFQIENSLNVDMQDLRKVHGLKQHRGRYAIHINRSTWNLGVKEPRTPFNQDGTLRGYFNFAPQGTILHPSVYLIFDVYNHVFLNSRDLPFRQKIQELRSIILPKESFWNDQEIINIEDPKAIRILVCGNTGIGKSTLINEVFGAELTAASDRSAGIHNIKDAITSPDRPDLIVHDSGGFEAGGQEELQQVREFIVDMCKASDIRDRLHVIWFCIEVSSTRTQQKAAKDFFSVLAANSAVPIVVVGTKKDIYWNTKFGESRQHFSSMKDMEAYAHTELDKRMREMQDEVDSIEDGRYDAIVLVSKDDRGSIQMLTDETAKCFDHEKVRASYVAAQVSNVDLKVDLAANDAMRIYKQTIKSLSATSFIPLASTTTRVTVAAVVCKAVVHSFGVPSVTSTTVQQIVKNVIWDDMGHNLSFFIAESITVCGVIGSLAMGGMPVFLATSLVAAPLIVPATARLILMLACDVTLILTRAFQECARQCLGHPQKKDIEKAAFAYKKLAKDVHKSIKELIPKSNMIKSYRYEEINISYRHLLDKHISTFAKE